MLLLLLQLMQEQYGSKRRLDRRIAAARQFLDDHFCRPISTAELSAVAHLSVRQLKDVFREQLGMTPHQYLTGFKAMSLAPAVEVSLLAYLWPVLIVLLSSLLPGESLRVRHIAGTLLALAGCWLLLAGKGDGCARQYLGGYIIGLRLQLQGE